MHANIEEALKLLADCGVDRYTISALSHLDGKISFYSGDDKFSVYMLINRSIWNLCDNILGGDIKYAILNIKHNSNKVRQLCAMRIKTGNAPLKGGFVFGFKFKVYLLEKIDELFEWIVEKKELWFEKD
jgi:hypothetical protein